MSGTPWLIDSFNYEGTMKSILELVGLIHTIRYGCGLCEKVWGAFMNTLHKADNVLLIYANINVPDCIVVFRI